VVFDPVDPNVGLFPSNVGSNTFTQRNNNQRTGVTAWRGLNQSSVSRFGQLAKITVPGAVLAQPLFAEAVRLADGERRSVIFVATSNNHVCAFEADPPFGAVWPCLRLGDPFVKPNDYPYANCDPAKDRMCEADCPGQMWNGIAAEIGIEATPAIDPVSKRMFISYRNNEGLARLAVINIANGQKVSDVPIESKNPIWNKLHRSRASLLIANGLVFVAFGGMCEAQQGEYRKSYQGWVYAFDTETLELRDRYRTVQSPSSSPLQDPADDPMGGGGIWQASTGPAEDGAGNVFFSTGNANKPASMVPPDPSWKNLSNSVIRLRITRETPTSLPPSTRLTVVDWFTPYRKVWQDMIDMDFGSAGVMLIPGSRYLVMGGKEGIVYLLDGNHLGHFDHDPTFDLSTVFRNHKTEATARDDNKRDYVAQKLQAGENQYCASSNNPLLFCFGDSYFPKDHPYSFTAPEILRRGPGMDDWISWPHIHGTPVFGEFGNRMAFLYVWPEKDHLKSFRWLGDHFKIEPQIATSRDGTPVLAPPFLAKVFGAAGMPGGNLSLTIDPSQSGQGVLFASVQRCRSSDKDRYHECSVEFCETASNCTVQGFGMLRAFDPITLAELWNDQTDGVNDYLFAKWVPPTIANGRVFLATASYEVLVYGTK
jgi:hypothetical protein